MKHHIAVKFIAVFLAALALLGAVGSAAGIICFTALNLYEQSVDDLYEENMSSTRQNLAMHLVHQYASLELGKLPEESFYNYWGTQWMYENFQYGYYFYSILNENGRIVESTTRDMPEGTTCYVHEVTDVNYRHLLGILSNSGPDVDYGLQEPTGPVQETFGDDEEATQPSPLPNMIEATVVWEDVYADRYYDSELGDWVEFTYYFDKLPTYTVELYLLPGAVSVEPVWRLLQDLWQFRYDLFYVLGFSLLVFAILMVYLCCAAGKKPGREETRAGGLNCIPLDLYAVGGGTAIALAFLLGAEVVEYLIRNSPDVLVPFAALAGYLCCLLLVSFLFACAAQLKTPGGYWWRNSILGRCLRLVTRLWCLLIKCCVWTFTHLPPFLKKVFRKLWSWAQVLLRWLLGCALAVWGVVKKYLLAIWKQVKAASIWFSRKLSRFYGMLPLTWQWLLTAFVMIFLVFLAFNARSGGSLLLCLGIYLAIVLYGTSAFGILMESAKRMSKGDLETKVSDQFLIGSFKEFAGDLNALADVAVVAAQKQLKSERMKTELITNVSHDIKTPLTSIINYVDLLQKPHTDEEQEMYLEVLSRQSAQLKKLIEDLMEMSKASTGNMSVDITAVNAGEAINQALGEFGDKLEKIQLVPVFRQPEEPIYMKADGRLAWRVMSNLLSNTVKYALPGTRLYIDLMALEGKVIISMKNISREELNVSADELLERFVRGDVSRNTEGSGLGLNIAKSLMELQKGQLQLLVDGDLFKVTLVFPGAQI